MPRPAVQTVTLPLGQTRAAIQPESVNVDARTAELVWTTGARVRRLGWDGPWFEELSLDDDAVDLARLNGGANLLAAHDSSGLEGIIGVVEDASLEGTGTRRHGRARVRFSSRADVEPVFGDVQAGIIRHVSVGYIVHELEEIDPGNAREEEPPVYRVTRWEPVEVSFVAVPADPGAGVRSQRESPRYPCLVHRRSAVMPKTVVADPPGSTRPKKPPQIRADERPPGAPEPQPGEGEEVPPPAPEPTPGEGEGGDDDDGDRAIAAERTRAREIRDAVRSANLNDAEAFADRLIADGVDIHEARKQVIAALRRQQPPVSRGAIVPGGEGHDRLRTAITQVILHRTDPQRHQLEGDAVQWQGYPLQELARALLEAQGIRTRGLARMELAAVALGLARPTMVREGPHGFLATSDFPLLLATVGKTTLTQGYTAAPRTFPAWTREGTLPDFRTATRVSLGVGPKLLKVPEHAEYTRGKLQAEGQPIALETWGRILAFTRKAMINDDLGLFTRIPQLFGGSAATVESDVVYELLTSNPVMADGQPLFSAAHGNLMPAAPITLQSIAAARAAMMNQQTPSGQFLTVTPAYLICGPQQEVFAAQFLVPITIVGTVGDVIPPTFTQLQLVVDPRITDLAWYLAGSPNQIDTIEYAYLEGAAGGGPALDTREGWDIDGQEYKARMEFGAAVIDWRGLVKNPGQLPPPGTQAQAPPPPPADPAAAGESASPAPAAKRSKGE